MMNWFNSLLLVVILSACWHKPKEAPDGQNTWMLSGNVAAGRLLYNNTCKTCHGESAEGQKKFQAPTLANSDTWYLYRQLMSYRNGIRGYADHDTLAFQMSAMAKTLKDSMAVRDVVAYIKIMPGVSVTAGMVGD